MLKQSIKSVYKGNAAARRFMQQSATRLAKGDSSNIDSFKLPSQTSINEWEFKYDFIPKTSQPKVPPVTKEAVKQDVAQEKAKAVERELFAKESNSSVKVEANDAKVLHGGESVGAEPILQEDRGSNPIDSSKPNVSNSAKPKKAANHDQYVQSSVNPNVNAADVVNLGENEIDHKTESVGKQTRVVDDLEHDNLHHEGQQQSSSSGSTSVAGVLALLGAGGAGYWYYTSSTKQAKK
ncbi:hypothetical protein CANMA_002320 [Candida margitis]|uniref:uncharacterized protein n=1 Tax=Candida margitis TaxID=1775924 RepID=UPI002225E12C|nr:uncharacterized protein CANMA_002320 [Candida margitis]KAI5968575.1 hypothetical protein CANMA_002320 [Candida margitis]